ncbi:MAG: cytochrome C [Verrucomicrobia bacterium]|nr:cytochrome C [Verrucomicrobiota bacterium]MDA1066797.1 cytochrome C [Verrucomicrobiota bacterium]
MAIFEFYCPDNHKIYQFYARNASQAELIPKCPDNPEYRMVKKVTGFAIGGVDKKSGSEGGRDGADMDDPKMMAAMAQLEKAMSGMDEDNPDPRQMGKLMRQMAEMTGEPLTGEMEEMVRKLEEGADPEGIEEQFGDLMGGDEGGEGMGSAEETEESGGTFRGPPLKDDTLYDFD